MSWPRRLAFIAFIVAISAVLAAILYDRYNRSVETNLRGAYRALKRGDFDETIVRCTPIIQKDRNNSEAYYLRGLAYENLDEFKLADADFGAVIKLENPDPNVYIHRAYVHLMLHDYRECVADCDFIIRARPDNSQAYGYRGDAYYWSGHIRKAIADFENEVQLEPTSAVAHDRLGRAYWRLHEYQKVAAEFTEAIRLDPSFTGAVGRLGWLRATCTDAKIRDGKQAVELGRKACDLSDWKRGEYLSVLAAAEAEAGDFAEAVKLQKRALEFPDIFRNAPGRDRLLEKARTQLALYQQHMPARDD